MSNQQQFSSTFSSSTSFAYSTSSSSSTTRNGVTESQVSGSRHAQNSVTDDSGTRTITEDQKLGEPVVRSERTDREGRELDDGGRERIQDAEQEEKDRLYEERMEEEYAKREGGA